ncbi:MAG: hypothetical protein Q9172_001644 [Xanthocarpia lactea]
MSPQTSPLKARDVNTSIPSPTKSEKPSSTTTEGEKPKSMEYHRQVLQSRLDEDQGKGQSLFANTTSKNAAANRNGSLDAEVGKVMDGEGKK